MTDRDRLIDLIYDSGQDYDNYVDSQHEIGMPSHIDYEDWLADDILSHGWIRLPCKLGDKVYYITGIHNTLVKEAKVEEIYCGEAGFAFHLCHDYTYFTLQQEDIFLTKEEAEEALKEREKNDR